MFRFFRKKREVMKYFLIAALGFVALSMVITLIPGLSNLNDSAQMQSSTLASFEGQDITATDLRRRIDGQLRGSPLGSPPGMAARMATSTLDELIFQRALLSQAKKLGLQVSNEELLQEIQSNPMLYQNGSFIGMDRYQDMIQQATGMSISQFESQMRQSLMLTKVRSVITDAVQVTPAEVKDEFLKRNSKAKIEYVLVDPTLYVKDVKVTPEALATYFQKDTAKYKLPEQRSVRYVLIDPSSIPVPPLTDADLKQYYNLHTSEYRVPERAKVAHILFKTTGKSEAEVGQIAAKAQEVLKQIKGGADFGDLAKKYSEDTATAPGGGELGWIVRGQTVKEFEDSAFTLQPGQISELVKTTYGYHILKVEERQQAHLQSFDEVKEAIRTTLAKQKLADAQQTFAAKVSKELKAAPTSFEAMAKKNGLQPKETPLFKYKQTVPDLGNDEGFENLTFQLRLNEVGMPITVPKGTAIIQLIQIVPEHTPKLDEVRGQVEEDYRTEQAKTIASDKAKEFAQQCKTADFAKVAKSMGLTVKQSNDFTQQDNIENLISGSELANAFAMAPGQTSDVIPIGTNNIVFRVVSHTPPDESLLAQQQDQLREELLETKRNLQFEIYRTNLKRQLLRSGALRLNDAAIQQFLAAYSRS